MEPITIALMLASAGASIGGSIYNMGVNKNNYLIQQARLKEERDKALKRANYQEANIMKDVETAQAQIEANVSADYASRAQAGQTNYGLSAGLLDLQSKQLSTQATRQLDSINFGRQDIFSNFNLQSEDMASAYQAQQIQQTVGLLSTALSSAAGITDYASGVNWGSAGGISQPKSVSVPGAMTDLFKDNTIDKSLNDFFGLSGNTNFKLNFGS